MLLNYFPALLPASFVSRCHFFLVLLSMVLLSACGSDNNPGTNPDARTVPQNVTLTPGTRINEINWSGISGARGYRVYWSTDPGVSPTTGTPIDTQQPYLEHRGLANGTTYYYVITSDTDFGQSAPSAVVEGTPQAAPPARPGDLAPKAGNGRITLRWEPVPGATHYTLYWSNVGVNTDSDAADTPITQVVSPFVHPGLENGQTYFYRLVAENAHGASDASEERSATPISPTPSAPVITQADVDTGQVILHWQHAGIASQYELYWSTELLSDNATENNAPLTQVTSPYTHTPLQDGQTYYYRVRTRNDAGVSALSNLVQITPPGDTRVNEPGPVPATPTGVTVSLENGQLSLDWPPVDDALGYNLYWSNDETGEITPANARITQIQPPYTHIQLNNGTRYRYRLSALNHHGESALSTEVNGTPQIIIPGVPAGVQALAGDQSILVRWNPVQNATDYTLTIDDGTLITTFTDVSSPYRISDLSNGITHQIQLQAQNAGGLSDFSAAITATPQEPVPNTPGSLVAHPGDAEVLLQWAAAIPQDINDPNEVITAYRVYTATRPGVRPGNSTLIDATPTRNNDGRWQLHHTALQNGQRYYYVVSAQNAGGESGISREVWARPQIPAPGIPANLSAEASDGQVLIHFTPPDNSEPSTTYNLYWTQALDDDAHGERSPTEVISNVQAGYLFSAGPNTNGTTYFFQVSAISNGNESPLSGEVSATPQIPAPRQAPQDVQALTGNGQVTLNWAPVAQASGYVIYWATEPDISPQASNRLSGEAIQPGFVHDGLDNGQSYFYRVVAINAGGESTFSALLAAQPQMPPPATPTGFVVQPGDRQVVINFALTPSATGYRVFWHPDVEAPLAQWSSRTVQPGDILTDLSNNQTGYYRLQAHNAGGNSPLTTPISATPQPDAPATPTGLTVVSNNDNELSIRWHTRPGLRYTLYWSDDPEIAPRDSDNVLNDVRPTYRHTGLSSDVLYRYQISASNSGGESPASETVQGSTGNNGTPAIPGTPQNVQGSTGDGQNTLQWQAVTGAEQYTVLWSTQSDMSEPQSTTVSTPSFVHNAPPASILYYQVIAQNSAGDSPPSTTVEIAQDIANEAPQITQGATTTVTLDEDSTPTAFALTLNATDNDSNSLIWSIATPANRGTAQIDSNNTSASVSYTPQANVNGSDTFTVQVDDGQGGTDNIQINVSITPQNDAPIITNTPLSLSIEENTTAVTAITVTDIDSTEFTYTLSGIDSPLFSMVGNTLTFNTAPDFENPQDSGRDNIYNVTITASDGGNDNNESAAKAFAITVTDVDDSAPVITLNGVNPVTLMQGVTYEDAGASATDDQDGSVGVTTSGSVDTSTLGTYTITYTATDTAGNISTATRTVNVVADTASSPFITTWKTDNPGISADNQIQIRTSGGGYNYAVDWGDGQTDNNVTGDITHTYAMAGTYTVSISGDFPRIVSDDNTATDAPKLLSIEQWGDIQWQSMNSAFSGCSNLVGNASDVPDLSQVTDMSRMFNRAGAFNQNISNWDVSSVTNMSNMFNWAIVFNQDISSWNVSSVTDMSDMFRSAFAFNQNLSVWDVASVTNMSAMFSNAIAFNQDLSAWDVSSVIDMSSMFRYARAFNQDISTWDVSSVTDMSDMFSNALTFNQDLDNWDVSSVIDMSNMFNSAIAFNQDLSAWDVSSVTDMSYMFAASTLNQSLSFWDVSSVTNMANMFRDALAFNQDISTWDVSSVMNMSYMFNTAWAFNQDLSAWDVSSVTDMSDMFGNAGAFNQSLNGWDVSSVINMTRMFNGARVFNQNLNAWDVSSVTDMSGMFNAASAFNGNLRDWNVSSVTNMRGMFLSALAFNQDLSNWNVSSVTSMVDMFNGTIVFNQDLSNWDVSSVTNMRGMFDDARVFNQDLSAWDVSSVTNMRAMFLIASAFDQNLNGWDVSSVTDMGFMFSNARIFNQDLSNWDVSSVTNMSNMFNGVTLSQANYDALLSGWSAQSLQSNVRFHGGNSQYSPSSQAARDTLTEAFGWTVTDGGVAPQ